MSGTCKLWLLRPQEGLPDDDNPWRPWFDKSFGFVVRAINEASARQFAHADAGNENRGEFLQERIAGTTAPWLDSKYSTCVALVDDGEQGVVMNDFYAA